MVPPFSYGKALQKTCIVTWMGKKENDAAAQAALTSRSKATLGVFIVPLCDVL